MAVDHTGNVLTDGDETPFAHWYHRPLDVVAAMDFLGELPAENPLSGLVAVDRAILTGHSRGAYTVWSAAGGDYDEAGVRAACGEGCDDAEVALFLSGFGDDRFVGVSPQAGTLSSAWFGESGQTGVTVPIFFMSGSADGGGTEEQWEAVEGLDFIWVELQGGCHLTFTLGILCDTLSSQEGWDLTNRYSLAFARRVLLGDDNDEVVGLLDGSVAVPRATVRVR
jgi:predicted dienelactone hydrolase